MKSNIFVLNLLKNHHKVVSFKLCDKDIHNNKEMIILNKQQVTRAIEKVLSSSKIGVLSTAHHNKPNSRYMVFYNDDLNLYTKRISIH